MNDQETATLIARAMSGAVGRIACIKYNERTVYVTPKGVVGKLCSQCFLAAFSELPNPDCECCMGEGEYYTHSDDCEDDLCALAGGYHDCSGKVVDCNCSIIDDKEEVKVTKPDWVDPTDYRCGFCKTKIDGSRGACTPCQVIWSTILIVIIGSICIGLVMGSMPP